MILRLAKLSLNKRRTYWVVISEQGNTKMNGLSMATRCSNINICVCRRYAPLGYKIDWIGVPSPSNQLCIHSVTSLSSIEL